MAQQEGCGSGAGQQSVKEVKGHHSLDGNEQFDIDMASALSESIQGTCVCKSA